MALNYSPEQWVEYLDSQISIRLPDCNRYESYYSGDHPLAFATSKFREAFGTLFSEFADNFMELVVDVPVDKLEVTGFDFGDDKVNEEAWKLWRLSDMEARARQAHTEAVKCRASYVLVDPVLKRLSVQHPKHAYVEVDPMTGERLAGMVRWTAVDGTGYANLYLPDRVLKYRATGASENGRPQNTLPGQERPQAQGAWELRDDVPNKVPNKLGVVLLVPLENNGSLLTGGKSDLEVAIPLQNVTNKLVTDMVVASEFQAFKQRVLTGVEVPRYPDDYEIAELRGKPVVDAELRATLSRAWFIEDADAKVTELGGTDLQNYVGAIEMSIAHLATKTRIPPQHFLSAGATLANVSTESMVVINDGFISKVTRKQKDFGPAWREVMRLLLRANGVDVPKPEDSMGETKWAPVMEPSIPGLADALVKLKDIGVPYEFLWRKLGATPEETAEWRKQADANARKEAADAKVALEAMKAAQPSPVLGPDGQPVAKSQPPQVPAPPAPPAA